MIKVASHQSGNPGTSGWDAILPQKPPARTLTEKITTDYLVIGGGFAGVSAAKRLHNNAPTANITLVDAIRIGEGAAGRSSGFMIDLPHDISAESYTGNFDADKAQTAMNRTALHFAAQCADDYGFDKSTFDPRGKINVSASDFGDHHNTEYADYLQAMGEKYEVLDTQAMREISGCDYYSSGLYTPGACIIQPADFVRKMARGLETEGISVYENTPVVSLEKTGATWVAETPNGTINTPQIILAVNGHIQSFGYYERRLMHIFLFASMTRPLTPDENRRLGGRDEWEFVPADPMGSTMRKIMTPQGARILTRNKFRYSPRLSMGEAAVESAAKDHDKAFRQRFPMLKEVGQEYRWGGRLCLSWNSEPVFGELEQGVVAAVCQNGLGASKGILSGMLAADYATGRESPHIETYLNAKTPPRLPPEPFSLIGATAYLNYKEWKAGREK